MYHASVAALTVTPNQECVVDFSTHMQDLKDVTCDIHYENYRAETISKQMAVSHKERGYVTLNMVEWEG